MELSSLRGVKFIVLIKERNDFDEINNFFMNNIGKRVDGHWRRGCSVPVRAGERGGNKVTFSCFIRSEAISGRLRCRKEYHGVF